MDSPGGPVAKTHVPNARGLGLIPDQRNRSHVLQLRLCMIKFCILQQRLKVPHAVTKTPHSQINKHFLNGV